MNMAKPFLLLLLLCCVGCKEQIIHDLSETESNRLITKLHQVGIPAEKTSQPDGTWALSVDRSDTIEALSALSDARVFRRSASERAETSSTMLPSRETQRFQYERAISREIELTLSALAGVLESRVHLNLPPTDPLFGRDLASNAHSSASVLLVTDGSFTEQKETIQALISGAAGINSEQISVLISAPTAEVNAEKVEKEVLLVEEGTKVAWEEIPAPVRSNFSVATVEKSIIPTSISSQTKPTVFFWYWGALALALFLVGLTALYFVKKRVLPRRRKVVKSSLFEEQLEGLSIREGRAA